MEEVKAKQEKEVDKDEKKVEETESGCVSVKSPRKVRILILLLPAAPFPLYTCQWMKILPSFTSLLFIFLSDVSIPLIHIQGAKNIVVCRAITMQ
jgi:hypothetical protein